MEDLIIPPKPEEVEMPPSVIKHLLDMTEEEREAIMCPRARESHERYMREGLYHCKGDRCKEMREKKLKDEQKQLEVLSQRNQILEQHARGLEIELKDYKTQTEERFNKLAILIASLK